MPRLHEFFPHVTEAEDGPPNPWAEAERLAPGCSAAWAAQGNESRGEVRRIVAVAGTRWPMATLDDGSVYLWYIDGWVRLPHPPNEARAWLILTGPGGGTVYVAKTRGPNGRIDAVGVDPEEVTGATPPSRPNGRISAELRGPAARSRGLADMLTVAGL